MVAAVVPDQRQVLLFKHFVKGIRPALRRGSQRFINARHRVQCVVVAPTKQMNAVLLNLPLRAPTGGALAAQAPAHLVERDALDLALPVWVVGQLKRSAQAAYAAAQDGDFFLDGDIGHFVTFRCLTSKK